MTNVVVHEPQQFYAGDTWEIEVSCHDDEDNPLGLLAASEIQWKLTDANGNAVVTLTRTAGDIYLASTDGVDGIAVVVLSASRTSQLQPGFYHDQLRVFFGTYVTTQVVGRIEALKVL